MTGLRHLSLRYRLLLAFFLVSAPPVLVASYVASQAISTAFQRNLEHWLEEAVRFVAGEASEGKDEADKSAAIVTAVLESRSVLDSSSETSIKPFVDLLTTAGYDLVKIYDENEETEYAAGSVELAGPLPKTLQKSVFPVRTNGVPGLAIGAVRPFVVAGRRHYVLIANLMDDKFFAISRALKSLEFSVLRVEESGLTRVADPATRTFDIPNEVLRRLQSGTESAVARGLPDDPLATAFAALRDDRGELIGVIVCRFTGGAAAFERLSEWQLFIVLALISGMISLLVGGVIAQRISRPVHALTRGLRSVAAGDYRARVPYEGGQDLEELAGGFNTMTEQLDRLRSLENEMRRRHNLASLGEAAAVIAHEIRNPLGIIKTSSQMVRMKSALKPSEDRLIGFVLDEVARIDRLVEEILEYVRPKEAKRTTVDLLVEVIDRVVEVARPELDRHAVTCAVIRGRDRALVSGDPDQLYQAFLNLVLNAIQAMPGGGRLTVEVMRDGGWIEVAVQDDGTGMESGVKDRIFDPFFTTKAKGTGLGLAKTKAIVEEHGGTISCDSEPGCGATFTVRLPTLAPEEVDAAHHLDR